MTYMLAEAELRPSQDVTVAPYDAIPAESLANLVTGDTYTAEDVFYGLMLPSGNDAANTLAIAVSGSVPDFVSSMNRQARQLGLSETSYEDPIGIGSGNVSSARDLARLTIQLRQSRLFRQIVDTERITLRSGDAPLALVNRNNLVLEEPFVNGVKTGTTLSAGYNLVSSGRQKDVELVSVLLGAPDESSRDSGSLRLLDYGFSLYKKRAVVKQGDPAGSVPISEGRGDLDLEAAGSVRTVARADQRAQIRLEATEPVVGPIAAGDVVGTAIVTLDGDEIGGVEVLAAQDVEAPPEPPGVGGLPLWAIVALGAAALIAVAMLRRAAVVRRSSAR